MILKINGRTISCYVCAHIFNRDGTSLKTNTNDYEQHALNKIRQTFDLLSCNQTKRNDRVEIALRVTVSWEGLKVPKSLYISSLRLLFILFYFLLFMGTRGVFFLIPLT